MNLLVQFKAMIVRVTILGALTLVAAFGQVPRTIDANVFSESSPEKMSASATGLNNPHREIVFDTAPIRTAPQSAAPIGSIGDTIFPEPFPEPTVLAKPRLADPTFFADASAVRGVPFALPQPENGKRSMAPQGTCWRWQFVADMPRNLYGAGCCSDGTFIYCAGGGPVGPFPMNDFNRYDPDTNTWTALAPMPNGSTMGAAVYYPPNNKIYVFGGSNGWDVIFNFNQIYDVASNAWTMGTPLPDVRAFMAYGYNPANGKIYLVGGYNTGFDDSGQPDTWEYDPAADTFTNKSDFPEHAGGYASGIINGHLYVAGGRDANHTSLNRVWDYDIAADTWTQKNHMPGSQNNGRGSAVVLDSLFVFGGGAPLDFPGRATNVYLPATDEWRTAPSLNVDRFLTSGAAVGNTIFAAGGCGYPVPFPELSLVSVEQLPASIPDPTPSPCPINQYSIAPGSDTIVPGDTDIGIHCDDCEILITLPFCFQLYDQTFSSVKVSSNGRLDFVLPHEFPETYGYAATCLPAPPGSYDGLYDFAIFGLWQDQQTDFGLSGCTSFPGGTCGVFTSISGSEPNRIFNIEWRTVLYSDNSATQNYEVRLYENDPLKKFEVIIRGPRPTPTPRPRPTPHPRPTPFEFSATQISKSSSAQPTLPFPYVSGVQGDSSAGFFTQDFCTFAAPQNVSRTYTLPGCGPALSPAPRLTARPRPTP